MAPKVGQHSSQFVNKVKQLPLPGKFSRRRQIGSAAHPKRLTQNTRMKVDTSDDDENPSAPPQTEPVITRRSLDNKSADASTNPTARSVGPVASPTKTKPTKQDKRPPHGPTVHGCLRIGSWDLGTELEEPGETLPEGKPKVRHSLAPTTPVAKGRSGTAEGLDRDDARTLKILTQMSAESRNTEAVDSSHLPDQPIDPNLVDLLEDDERILGGIKAMKEAEYPKLLDIAVILLEFEQLKKKFEHEGSEEAVLEEIGGDESPIL
jgi:hypothetical protein